MKTKELSAKAMSGVWSAAPTPLLKDMTLDRESLKRMIDHHVRLGVKGVFLLGSAGEGPMLTDKIRREVMALSAEFAAGRLYLAAQVTDNSAPRILDNIADAHARGMDIAVICSPYFQMNPTADVIANTVLDSVRQSPLPIGIYDRKSSQSTICFPKERLAEIYAEKNVRIIKDSSMDEERAAIALKVRKDRPDLCLLSGYEFDCVKYLKMGYDGLLLGGAVFHARIAARIMDACARGDEATARSEQERVNRLMYDVFGGEKFSCWLSGQKRLLVELGIFTTHQNFYHYPLTDECVAAIKAAAKREKADLLP